MTNNKRHDFKKVIDLISKRKMILGEESNLYMHDENVTHTKIMFASLIIRTFQLLFSARTVFFSHNKSIGTVFQLVFSAKRTEPLLVLYVYSLCSLSL